MLDLHLHSTYSDGTLSPKELIRMARQRRLSAVSITDHDTAAGTEEAQAEGLRCGLQVISGLELSVSWQAYHFHLLAYDFDWQNAQLQAGLQELQDARNGRNSKIVDILGGLGLPINDEELRSMSGYGQTGRPHIARLLVAKQVVRTIDQAFERYLRKGACAYVSRFVFTAEQAFELIHTAGGIAVLAHPGQIASSMSELEYLLDALKSRGLDGMETFYPTQKGRQFRQLRALAHRFQLLETGGSDYHGDIRPGSEMAGGRALKVPDEILQELRQRQTINKELC